MSVKVRIPTPLQKLTKNQSDVECEGANVGEIIQNLESQFPGIKDRLCETDGKLRRFINVYVNEEDIRFQSGVDTQLKSGDDISIIPAIAGGATRHPEERSDEGSHARSFASLRMTGREEKSHG